MYTVWHLNGIGGVKVRWCFHITPPWLPMQKFTTAAALHPAHIYP